MLMVCPTDTNPVYVCTEYRVAALITACKQHVDEQRVTEDRSYHTNDDCTKYKYKYKYEYEYKYKYKYDT
jgi:hypothetical protein